MAQFRYDSIDSKGVRSKGITHADSRESAILKIKQKGLVPTSITEVRERKPQSAPAFGKVSIKHLSVYTRKFAELIKTDIPLTEIFEILAEEEENSQLREASKFLGDEIAKGRSLIESMKFRPMCFSPLYIRMFKAGMESGTLDAVAQNLAKLYEMESAYRQRLISKLWYPAGLLAFCFLTILVTRYFHVLNEAVFATVMSFWIVVIAIILFGITRPGYSLYRQIGFHLPWIGDFMRKINLARFCRIFGLQYSAGVPVLEGLDLSKSVLQDPALSRAVSAIQRRINDGMSLRDAMVSSGVFPKRVIGMVGAGEAAGGVEIMLRKLAEYYELDVETGSTVMATVIWFVSFILVAITIGAVVISLWMNYWHMYDQFLS